VNGSRITTAKQLCRTGARACAVAGPLSTLDCRPAGRPAAVSAADDAGGRWRSADRRADTIACFVSIQACRPITCCNVPVVFSLAVVRQTPVRRLTDCRRSLPLSWSGDSDPTTVDVTISHRSQEAWGETKTCASL